MYLAIKLAPLGRVHLITFATFIILEIVFAIAKMFLISSFSRVFGYSIYLAVAVGWGLL